MIRRIVYFFTVALHSFKRNFSITVGTVALLGMAFFLYSAFLLGAWNVARMAERWIGQVRVIAFLKEETDDVRARALLSEIRLMTGVEEADYIDREAARRRFLDDFPGDAAILEGTGETPLPASIEIRLAEAISNEEALTAFSLEIGRLPGVEEAVFGRELFVKLSGLLDLLRWVGVVLSGVLALAVLFLIHNTIRLGLLARRDEIQICEIVGATRAFIRWPYLIEGGLQGFLSSLAALLALVALDHVGRKAVTDALSDLLGVTQIQFLPLSVALSIPLWGTLLGMIASAFAVQRFFRRHDV